MLSTGDSLQIKRYTQTKSKGMEKYISQKWEHLNKKSWGSNTYPRQIDFKTKAITRDKEGHGYSTLGIYLKEPITLNQKEYTSVCLLQHYLQ